MLTEKWSLPVYQVFGDPPVDGNPYQSRRVLGKSITVVASLGADMLQ